MGSLYTILVVQVHQPEHNLRS